VSHLKLCLVFALTSALSTLTGCATSSSDDGSVAAEQPLTANPAYAEVASSATKVKVENDTAITATQSFKSHVIAFYPGKPVEAVTGQFLKFDKWTEIREADGSQPFLAAVVSSDTTDAAGTRTIAGKFTLKENVPMEMLATIKRNADGDVVVHAENSADVIKCVGIGAACVNTTVCAKGKLQIDVVIGKFQNGIIADATMAAKAANPLVEGMAVQRLAPVLPAIVSWSQAALQ
jgi:SH3-like domain-containing protein